MVDIPRRTLELTGISPNEIPFDELLREQRPTIFRGMARAWPLVRLGLESPVQAMAYLEAFYDGRPVVGYSGGPEIKGRFSYNSDCTGLNFQTERVCCSTSSSAAAAASRRP